MWEKGEQKKEKEIERVEEVEGKEQECKGDKSSEGRNEGNGIDGRWDNVRRKFHSTSS